MQIAGISPTLPDAGDSSPKPRTGTEAASQFEALLLGQMLRSAHDGSGLSGEQQDSATETMWDMGAQQFAQVLAKSGGLGIGRMIASSLSADKSSAK
jgi:Rod binding domain-containing protein